MRLLFLLIPFFSTTLLMSQTKLFKESGNEVGINYIYPGNDNQEVGAGVTVLDINNDGWDDVFLSGGVFKSKLWINHKGKFYDSTDSYFGVFLDSLFIQSAVSGDYDNDGYTDLFVCNFGTGMRMGDKKPSILFKNYQGKFFEPVFTSTFSSIGNFTSASWGDINLDGYLDLYVTNYVKRMNNISDTSGKEIGYDPNCMPNYFYLNNKGNGFIDKTNAYGLDDNGCGLMTSFTDIDNDGDVDLLLLNDFGEWNHKGNRLFLNNYPEDKMTDVSIERGFYFEMYGMGIGPGDYDNDGDLDYYITNIGANILLNNRDSGFYNESQKLGVKDEWTGDSTRGTAWSGIFFDYDNDGDQDLYVSKGNVKSLTPKTAIADPNKFYINNSGNFFIDTSQASGVDDILSHRGAGVLDFDHDGDLDIISSVVKMHWSAFGGIDQRTKVFTNLQKTKNKWIGIKLIGMDGVNTDALGSKVQIDLNGKILTREVDGGSGHSSQSTKTLYFGLGKKQNKVTINITWLGGKKLVIKDLKPNHVYTINTIGKVLKIY